MAGPPIVVVSLGTDHHQFGRLIDWMEVWAAGTAADVRVQHGSTRPMRGAINRSFLAPEELRSWMEAASAIVLQGGPGGIVDALRAGVHPIVVPRLRRFGEAVDDHQVAFAHRMSVRGLVTVAESSAQLAASLAGLEPRCSPVVDLTEALDASGPAAVSSRLSLPPPLLSPSMRLRRTAGFLQPRPRRTRGR